MTPKCGSLPPNAGNLVGLLIAEQRVCGTPKYACCTFMIYLTVYFE
jgi:hypothetical protein